ncbi:hypothetical protein HK405_007914, partial [Cladochytrium tenue]
MADGGGGGGGGGDGSGDPPELTPRDRLALFHNLQSEGLRLAQAGQHAEADALFSRALDIYAGEPISPTGAPGPSGGGGGAVGGDAAGGAVEVPDLAATHVLRARSRIHLGDTAGALQDAQCVLQVRPSHARAMLAKAEALYARGDFEDALVLFHRGRRARPEMDGFYVGVVKATDSILSAVRGLDVARARDAIRRRRERLGAAAEGVSIGVNDLAANLGAGAGGADDAAGGAVAAGGGASAALAAQSKLGKPPQTSGARRPGSQHPLPRAKSVALSVVEDSQALAAAQREQQTQERNLLEELFDDKQFLEELQGDERFMAAGVGEYVREGLRYLGMRTDFWRQRNPRAVAAVSTPSYVTRGTRAAADAAVNRLPRRPKLRALKQRPVAKDSP